MLQGDSHMRCPASYELIVSFFTLSVILRVRVDMLTHMPQGLRAQSIHFSISPLAMTAVFFPTPSFPPGRLFSSSDHLSRLRIDKLSTANDTYVVSDSASPDSADACHKDEAMQAWLTRGRSGAGKVTSSAAFRACRSGSGVWKPVWF
jgi:hypothetical protein